MKEYNFGDEVIVIIPNFSRLDFFNFHIKYHSDDWINFWLKMPHQITITTFLIIVTISKTKTLLEKLIFI